MAAAAVTLDALKREARALELRIESRLNEHARLDGAAADVESGSAEAAAAREIDAALLSLSETTAQMSREVAERPSRADSAMVKRFNEVLLDFKTTFRKQVASQRETREKAALFREAKSAPGAGAGSGAGAEMLLRERGSLIASTRAMDEILAQAAGTSEALARQRAALAGSAGDVGELVSRLPVIGGLVDGLRGQRIYSDRVVAVVIALVVCFFLWLFFLRRL